MQNANLSKLNQRQFRFCTEYVFGQHFGNAARCYALAYSIDDPTTTACRANACRLLKKPKVRRALDALRLEFREQERLTPEQHLSHLEALREDARASGQFSAAVRAEELRGKAMGFYMKRHLHDCEPASRNEVIERLRSLVNENPSLRELFVSQAIVDNI